MELLKEEKKIDPKALLIVSSVICAGLLIINLYIITPRINSIFNPEQSYSEAIKKQNFFVLEGIVHKVEDNDYIYILEKERKKVGGNFEITNSKKESFILEMKDEQVKVYNDYNVIYPLNELLTINKYFNNKIEKRLYL